MEYTRVRHSNNMKLSFTHKVYEVYYSRSTVNDEDRRLSDRTTQCAKSVDVLLMSNIDILENHIAITAERATESNEKHIKMRKKQTCT